MSLCNNGNCSENMSKKQQTPKYIIVENSRKTSDPECIPDYVCNKFQSEYKKLRDAPGFQPILTKDQQEIVDAQLKEISEYQESWKSKIPFRYNGLQKDCFFFAMYYLFISFVSLFLIRWLIQQNVPESNGIRASLEDGTFMNDVKHKWPIPMYRLARAVNEFFYSRELSVRIIVNIFSPDQDEMDEP